MFTPELSISHKTPPRPPRPRHNVGQSASLYVFLSCHVFHTKMSMHAHTPVKPLPSLTPPFFPSINSVTPSSGPWHYRKTEQRKKGGNGEGRRRWVELNRSRNIGEKGMEIVKSKRERFKDRVRGWEAVKRLRGTKWLSEWKVSEGHVSDFLNVMRQHGGGCSLGWRSGEANLMAYTSEERKWSPWKKELNNSNGCGKRKRRGWQNANCWLKSV